MEVNAAHIYRVDSGDLEEAQIIDAKGTGVLLGTRLSALAVSFVYSAFRWSRK